MKSSRRSTAQGAQPFAPTIDIFLPAYDFFRKSRREGVTSRLREQARKHGERWDAAQRSPWYCYPDGNAFIQGWYNDDRAWNAKLDWIRAQGLGGIGLWVLDGVHDPPERWAALRRFVGGY